MKRFYLFVLTLAVFVAQAAAAPIGSWNNYQAYGDITQIECAGNKVYVLSSKGLYSYNNADNSIQTYDKMNALNDCGISHIAYCEAAKRLVIVYDNYNIDLLDDNGEVVNVSAYYSKSMTTDKTINQVDISGPYAYISTAFGIVQLNVAKAEISNSYNLDKNIVSTAVFGQYVYAALKDGGIWQGDTKKNILDKANWTACTDITAERLFVFDNHLIALTNGKMYVYENGEWKVNYQPYFNYSHLTGGKIILTQPHHLYIIESLTNKTDMAVPDHNLQAFAYDPKNNCYWSNQDNQKLYSLNIENNQIVAIKTDLNPDGPAYNYFGFMKFYNDKLYTCGGGFSQFAELRRKPVIQVLENGEWTLYNNETLPQTGYTFIDLNCLDIDPANPDHVFAGGRTGLYEYLNGELKQHFTVDNSPLTSAIPGDPNNKNYVIVSGIKFDKEGNLWCLNSQSESESILKLQADKTWESHHNSIFMVKNTNRSLYAMKDMILDSRGYLWFVNNHWWVSSFYCFDPKTDALNYYQIPFVNQDGTTVENVNGVKCIAEDKDANIWIGTNVGPLQLPASDLSEGSNAALQQIKVPRNDGTNFADYLLSGVEISCMAIDGGNRKWFGTNGNGVYLISADNMEQLENFTATNSNLLSNIIESIAINDKTGEVFISTDKGLCSYMSDASSTSDEMTKDNVYAYPNPVKPDYTGLITVVGLSYNADVKIVTAHGVLVREGKSNGGTFTWDGCDTNGHKVASGVYMVQTATDEGEKGTVCKIAIVR